VARDAKPSRVLVNPGIGEPAEVLVGLAAIDTVGVRVACYDGGGSVHFHLDILDVHQVGLELRIREIPREICCGRLLLRRIPH